MLTGAFLLLFCLLVTVVHGSPAQTPPAHLKPGALTASIGTVSLVEDVLWVSYPYTPLLSVPETLLDLTAQLQEVMFRLEEDYPVNYVQDFKTLIHARFQYLNDTITMALSSYNVEPSSNRSKRGLIDGLGELSRLVFGTAMDSDVEELRDQYTALHAIAVATDKEVRLNSRNIARLQQNLHDLSSYTNILSTSLNEALQDLRRWRTLGLLDQALPVLENAVTSLLYTNQQVVGNLVDAARGKVTSSLLPVSDLLHALDIGASRFNLKPLFDRTGIHHYYPVLKAGLTTTSIIIYIPFQSGHQFEAFRVEPFPFQIEGVAMTLDLESLIVLVNKDYTLYATIDISTLDKCKTEFSYQYLCQSSLFAFFPVSGAGVCEVILTQNDTQLALSLCPYRRLVPAPLYHRSFFGYHYFYFTEPYFVSVVCPEGSSYQNVSGHLAVPAACHLRSDKLSTFPEKLHQGFVAARPDIIVPLGTLTNITLSGVKFVTNAIPRLNLTYVSDFETAVQDNLPLYLRPSVHFSSFVVPFVLLIVGLIALTCVVRRALSLYIFLDSKVKQAHEKTGSP